MGSARVREKPAYRNCVASARDDPPMMTVAELIEALEQLPGDPNQMHVAIGVTVYQATRPALTVKLDPRYVERDGNLALIAIDWYRD